MIWKVLGAPRTFQITTLAPLNHGVKAHTLEQLVCALKFLYGVNLIGGVAELIIFPNARCHSGRIGLSSAERRIRACSESRNKLNLRAPIRHQNEGSRQAERLWQS